MTPAPSSHGDIRIVECVSDSGWSLEVRRVGQHFNSTLSDPDGRVRYEAHLYPTARTAIDGAVEFTRQALGLSGVATALLEGALLELRQ